MVLGLPNAGNKKTSQRIASAGLPKPVARHNVILAIMIVLLMLIAVNSF